MTVPVVQSVSRCDGIGRCSRLTIIQVHQEHHLASHPEDHASCGDHQQKVTLSIPRNEKEKADQIAQPDDCKSARLPVAANNHTRSMLTTEWTERSIQASWFQLRRGLSVFNSRRSGKRSWNFTRFCTSFQIWTCPWPRAQHG